MRVAISLACLLFLTALTVAFVLDRGQPTVSEDAFPQHADTISLVDWERKDAEARKVLAFESLTHRLPKGKPVPPAKPLDAASRKRWETLDRNLADTRRADLIRALHERTQDFFVNSPGEGPGRVIRFLSDDELLLDPFGHTSPPDQPGEPADFPGSAGDAMTRVGSDDEFHFHHDGGLSAFFDPRGFGYVQNRDRVAGFQSHGFRHFGVPAHESKRWRVHHVLLVGLLSSDEPVVYLTDRLPSMDQVRQGKTRALDVFEETALPSLRDGEDLSIIRKDDTIRMLGALRATKTCQKCHDAAVGDLLGAFSYTLRPAPKETKPGQ